MTTLRKTGPEALGYMLLGTHFCHFFQTKKDLLEILIPFFRAGLEANELCVWLVDDPLTEHAARIALKQGIPDSDRYLADGRLEIASGRSWYLQGGRFSMQRVLRAWDEKLADASAGGYDGLRVNGSPAWLQRHDWKRFDEYERTLNESFSEKPMIVLCSYALEKSRAADVIDVARAHQYAIAKRGGEWEVLESRPPPSPSDPALTTREQLVLLLAAEGFTNPQIAKQLSISVRTVESHRASLMRKLGLRHQTDLVRYALRRGILPSMAPVV